ncbi:MAG: hypothetical protein ACOYJZ_02980 [Acutalibacter sp.]|jgi:hypothetical protein
MKDSAGVKRENKMQIWKLLVCGKAYTKQQIALQTGLSVASCNTYLNEMETTGEVIGEKQKLHGVGRNAVVYRLNEEFESILCVFFEWIQGVKSITTAVLSPIGNLLYRKVCHFSLLDAGVIEQEVAAVLSRFSNVTQIVVGTPSVAENGVIRHSDLPELENVPLKALLEGRFHLPVSIANDMHYKVYGYYRQEQVAGEIVTLVNYPSGVLPGTATVHKGVLLTGRNLFAGMVGFLDYGMSLEQQLTMLQRPTAQPLIVQASIALISILNPHRLLFTGDLLEEGDLKEIRLACQRCIPEEYLPEFTFLPSTEPYYLKGMYWVAMDRKERINDRTRKDEARIAL